MSLQFVIGNAGNGKSYFMFQQILTEASKHPNKNYLVIVPEQFTMQTQRELVQLQTNHCIMNVDVLSFDRLAYRVFDEVGGFTYQVLDDMGKNLLLRRIAQEKKDKLTILSGNMTKMGYIDEMKSLISELMQYRVSPEDLLKVKEKVPGGTFSFKLNDVFVMYQGFLDYLENRFIAAEEILDLLCDRIRESKILKDAVVLFDGFTGFTPVQNQVVRQILKLAEKVYVTVTMDVAESWYHIASEHELFAMSKKMIASLTKIADDSHIEMEEPIVIKRSNKSRFSEAPALDFLEQKLFRSNTKKYQLEENTKEITITSYQNPREELEDIARKITSFIRDGQYRYRDIAIVCGDFSKYGEYAKQIFEQFKIPVFLDQKTTLLFHPFMEYLMGLLEIEQKNYAAESMFRYLRTGLCGIEREEIDILENYVLAAGIRGVKKWSDTFCYEIPKMEESDFQRLNEIRKKVMQPLEVFHKAMKKKEQSIAERCEAVLSYLEEQQLEEILYQKAVDFENKKDLKRAKEYEQIYDLVIELLLKIKELLGEEEVTLEEFIKILSTGLEGAEIGIIPPGFDRVTFGDIERSRFDHPKILFFAGVNDGVIPKAAGTDGIFTQSERELFAEQKIELAPCARERAYIQKYYLYLVLTKPSRQLHLSYTRVDASGTSTRPSYLIKTIQKLYDALSITEIEQVDFKGRIVSTKNSLPLLAEGIASASRWEREKKKEEEALWLALYEYMEQDTAFHEKTVNIRNASHMKYDKTKIAKAVSNLLFGTDIPLSVTRLEQYVACAYAHFLSYGLMVRERQMSSFESSDLGTIVHDILDQFAKLAKEHGGWRNLSEEEMDGLLEISIQRSFEQNQNMAVYENARNEYALERIRRILKRTVWALTKQIKAGSFVPSGFEVSFGSTSDLNAVHFSLNEEEKVHLRGRIDRIDTYEDKDFVYVKVMDYKSGSKQFEFINIYHGLTLQLVVYMNVALEMMEQRCHKRAVPAGLYYYQVKDPMVESEQELSEEELEQKIFEELKLDGYTNDAPEIYSKIDEKFTQGEKKSDIVSLTKKKDGQFDSYSKAMNTEEFQLVCEYVNQKMRESAQAMVDGNITISPYMLQQESGCDYCKFHSICQFDPKINGYDYRKLEQMKEKDVLERIKTIMKEEQER